MVEGEWNGVGWWDRERGGGQIKRGVGNDYRDGGRGR